MRKSAILVASIICLFLSACSSEFTDSQIQESKRPAAEMFNFGEKYFPYPEWTVTITENDTHTQVAGSWVQPGNIFHYRLAFKFKSLTLDELLKSVDEHYILETFSNYGKATLVQRCVVKNHIIVYAEAPSNTYKDVTYTMRFWVWSDEEGWHEVFMAFAKPDKGKLDEYADSVFDATAKCPASSKQ